MTARAGIKPRSDWRKAAQAGGMAVALADVARERKGIWSAGTARRRTPSADVATATRAR
jgi:hypothetical protein